MTGHRGARVARLAIALVVGLTAAVVHAEPATVALLPLDAEARLEVYGQPVAAEIAKTLRNGAIDVVVVTAKGSVPPTTKLVVDGALAQGKTAGAVVLQLRVRNPADGTLFDKLDETASSLTALPMAASKLAGRLLPLLRTRLEALVRRPETNGESRPANKAEPPDPVMLVGIGVADGASMMIEPLRASFAAAVGQWVRASRRQATPVDASVLGKLLATQTVATAKAERGIVFEILDYTIEEQYTDKGQRFPLARARVRVRIAEPDKVVFDHVIATDTIVGDRDMRGEMLAARVVREVLTILRPHMKRLEPTWR